MPDCDVGNNNRDISYDQPWLHDAIPLTNGKFDSCSYFARKNTTIPNQCTADMFDKSKRIQCTEFIYASDERNIQTEVESNIFRQFIQTKYFFIKHFSVQHSLSR